MSLEPLRAPRCGRIKLGPQSVDLVRVVEKRPWPMGETSPWAGEEELPTVMQVVRWYPARLVGTIFFSSILGAFVAVPICLGINVLSDRLTGVVPFSSEASLALALLAIVPPLVWLAFYGEIRGWWTSGED